MKGTSNHQKSLRYQVVHSEEQANFWYLRSKDYETEGFEDSALQCIKNFHHFMSRRRFFLSRLLSTQIKEFDCG